MAVDRKRTVACDFEDTFMCGYTTTIAGAVMWERVSGKTLGVSVYDKRGTFHEYSPDCQLISGAKLIVMQY